MMRAVSVAGDDVAGALRVITEAAAVTLNVAVVGVWSTDVEREWVRGLHVYERARDRHALDATIALRNLRDYADVLENARILVVEDAFPNRGSPSSSRSIFDRAA